MKKFWLSIFMLFAFVISTFATALPDEGMWLPMFVKRLNYVDMQKWGFISQQKRYTASTIQV